MSQPPINNTSYFDILVNIVRPFFEENGVLLNFDKYNETVLAYQNMNTEKFNEVERLSIDFNAWAEYFSDLCNLTKKFYLDAETDKKKTFVENSVKMDSNKVANGDRLASKEPEVILARKKRNAFQAFELALEEKKDFACRCHHHCKATCGWLNANYENKSIK